MNRAKQMQPVVAMGLPFYIKVLEVGISVIITYVHFDDIFDITYATFIAFLVVNAGLVLGVVTKERVPRDVRVLILVMGVCCFLSSGFLTFHRRKYLLMPSEQANMLTTSFLSGITALTYMFDICFEYWIGREDGV